MCSHNWAELWLVKSFFYTIWVKIQLLETMLTLLDFGSCLKNTRFVGKSSACPIGVFSMQPNPPKCHIRQQSIKSINLAIQLKILESSAWACAKAPAALILRIIWRACCGHVQDVSLRSKRIIRISARIGANLRLPNFISGPTWRFRVPSRLTTGVMSVVAGFMSQLAGAVSQHINYSKFICLPRHITHL